MPGSWDIQQGYNCIQEYMVVKPEEQIWGGFCSHQILRIELQPCNSEHGWLFSVYNVWVSTLVVVKTLRSLPCMDSATWFPSLVSNAGLFLLCCCSGWQFSFSRLWWTVPFQYLPPHSGLGTFWSSPGQMSKVCASSSQQQPVHGAGSPGKPWLPGDGCQTSTHGNLCEGR